MSAAATVLAASCGIQAQADRLSIERITLPLANLRPEADGFKIVVMSDFHARTNSEMALYESAVEIANNLEPDLVTLLGDYVNSSAKAIDLLSPLLGQIQSRYGVYAAMGNHEHASDLWAIIRSLEKVDIPALRNSGTMIGQDLFYLAALDDAIYKRHNISQALADQPDHIPTVLMAHEPDVADEVAKTGNVALQLSGHSHGGQIRLPLLGATVLPRLGKKYDMGLYQVEDMWVYTTRGIGTNNIPYRLNCPPEITEITLVRAEESPLVSETA